MASDKTIHKAFRIHETLFMNKPPLENYFIFTIYQNYTLALIFFHTLMHSFINFFLQDFSCTFKGVIRYMVLYKCRESLHYQELTMIMLTLSNHLG